MLIDQKVRYGLIQRELGTPPSTILEIGAGAQTLSKLIRESGHKVFCCDLDISQGEYAFLADGSQLPIPSDLFDYTISCDVLEHVQVTHRKDFLSEMIRVTKPGGVVVLTFFVRNTRTFRLFGALTLFLRGMLPKWYIEHITIPLPKPDEIEYFLGQTSQIKHVEFYQGSLNLALFWIQYVLGVKSMGRLSDFSDTIKKMDLLGRRTSCIIVTEKPIALD